MPHPVYARILVWIGKLNAMLPRECEGRDPQIFVVEAEQVAKTAGFKAALSVKRARVSSVRRACRSSNCTSTVFSLAIL